MDAVGSTKSLFSSDEARTIERSIDSHPLSSSITYRKGCLQEYYEIDNCSRFILSRDFKQVALQFPDFLLCDSVWVVSQLSTRCPSANIFILGDTSYGRTCCYEETVLVKSAVVRDLTVRYCTCGCCVDEVAAEHSFADCIIHFGPSCLTRTTRLPVLYVFGREYIDIDHCATALKALFPDPLQPILILYDVGYAHAVDKLRGLLMDYVNTVISDVTPAPSPEKGSSTLTSKSSAHQHSGGTDNCTCVRTATKCPLSSETTQGQLVADEKSCQALTYGRTFTLHKPIEEYSIYYIGYESLTMSNLVMNYSSCKFYSYNPISKESRQEGVRVNKALGRRYYLIQKAKEASTIGILVGTLGVAGYVSMIERLKKVIKSAGKKYYTFAMGKLNPAKMANFMEVDVYVLVACPENSLVESQVGVYCKAISLSLKLLQEFFKPVITPYELEVACIRERQWLGQVVSDFHKLLPGGTHHMAVRDTCNEENDPEYSFVSAKMVSLFKDEEESSFQSKELVEKKEEDMKVGMYSEGTAANFLQSRSWRGLEQNLGETPVSKVTVGLSGLPVLYDKETVADRSNDIH